MSSTEVVASLTLGGWHFARGQVLAARDAWETACSMLSPEVDSATAVRVHNALGSLFLELAVSDVALHYFEQAKTLCEALAASTEGALGDYPRVLNNLALTHLRAGDIDSALPLARQAVELAQRLGSDDELVATVNLVSGVCLLNHEEWDEARLCMEYALATFQRMGAGRGQAMCLNNLGIIALEQGHIPTAQKLLEAALEVLTTVHDVALSAYVRTELGRLHFREGNVPGALHHGSAALRVLWDNMGQMDRAEVARLCRLFGSIFSLKGDRRAAMGYLQRATTYFAQSQMWREWGKATQELDGLIRQHELPKTRVAVEWGDQELLRYLTTLLGFMDTLESLYPESLRTVGLVTRYAAILGREAGLDQARLARLRSAARLRDVGLTSESETAAGEEASGGGHPVMGKRILAMFGVPDEVLRAVHSHHENYDGSGYPEGLSGDSIPLEARILALVERYVAAVDSEIADGPGFHHRAMVHLAQNKAVLDPELLELFVCLHQCL